HTRQFSTSQARLSGEVRVRFAPSPTGMMHLGGLRTALYNYLFARSQGGKFILRIEDTDQTRLVPGAYENIIEVLDWAGLTPDEGPHVGGEYGPYIQTQRLPIYQEKIQELLKTGAAYKCFCSEKRIHLLKKEAAKMREVFKYDNKCRSLTPEEVEKNMANGLPYTVRLKLEDVKKPWNDMVFGPLSSDIANHEGDPVLMKSSNQPTYHFANVVDDHLMKITHVLRGVEWQGSTPKHLLLYRAFGWEPPRYAHLPLIVNSSGKKFSKRQDDVRVEHYMKNNYIPAAVLNLITMVGGGFTENQPSGRTLEELVPLFTISSIVQSPGKLKLERVDHMNKLHMIRKLQDPAERMELINSLRNVVKTKYSGKGEMIEIDEDVLTDEFIGKIFDNFLQERICRVEDFVKDDWEFLWTRPTKVSVKEIQSILQNEPNMFWDLCKEVESMPESEFTQEKFLARLKEFAKRNNYKIAHCMKLLRQSISGKTGPPVAEMIDVLGKKITLQRLQYFSQQLET
ncbi:probable glutamate--tRNA ligase, mitochondrial, partial [Lingula anatina]|uniref:Nondiscriminating glutamyl-tRNA synthetase EARS2, mitochondrial n=1 Tax=Lingula anatina TaxID=7574 RepID=A0A1S3JVD0_LINAN